MKRTFKTLKSANPEANSSADWDRFLEGGGMSWDELLAFKRILMISEAGAGKTHECREQARMLFDQGEAAFFLPLERVASGGLMSILYGSQEQRFCEWRASSSQVAFFFLDSVDELQLVHGSFRDALSRLAFDLAGALGRATIVVTSRPVAIDRLAFKELLPCPSVPATEIIDGEEFVRIATNGMKEKSGQAQQLFVEVALQPLSNGQIIEFARTLAIPDPEVLLAAIEAKNAHDFARRPQDLIELCDDWRDHGRIRAHLEQVRSHIFVLLSASNNRREQADLPVEKARLGAQRIALAAILGRRLTIRHSPGADTENTGDAPLDPRVLLQRWGISEVNTLLERPIFGEAGYGRVRFQHRSVMEYLAACQIHELIDKGVISLKHAKHLLFGLTDGNEPIPKPSMRPVTGWLAQLREDIFDAVLRVEPTILLIQGDPESLTDAQRERALSAFVERYGKGQWRGIQVPDLQVNRLAQAQLASAVLAAWERGVENPEVREMLLRLVTAGRFAQCADLAASVAGDAMASDRERFESILALSRLGDPRLEHLVQSALTPATGGSLHLAQWVCARLYPQYVSDDQLLDLLAKVEQWQAGDYAHTIARVIEHADLPINRLRVLLHGLLALTTHSVEVCYNELVNRKGAFESFVALRTVCVLLLGHGCLSPELLQASVLVLRFAENFSGRQKDNQELRTLLAALPPAHRRQVYAADLACLELFESERSSQHRFVHLAYQGALDYSMEKDWHWILAALSEAASPKDDRAVLLRLAVQLASGAGVDETAFEAVRGSVADSAPLQACAAEYIEATKPSEALLKMQEEQRRRADRQRRKLEAERESWLTFWSELANRTALALAPGRMDSTLWNLWVALRKKDGDDGRWDRPFMEKNFGVQATNLIRQRLMVYWRSMKPTTRSERLAGEKNTYLVVWSIGLMGIYAEAENPSWAQQLSGEDAALAARYALLELNGLPAWLASLSQAHPDQVEHIIGCELADELAEATPPGNQLWVSVLLQGLRHGPKQIAKLLQPRLQSWLAGAGATLMALPHAPAIESKLDYVLRVLLTHSDSQVLSELEELVARQVNMADENPFLCFWMSVYCQVNLLHGTEKLLHLLANLAVEKDGTAVRLIGSVFNGHRGKGAINWSSALPTGTLADLTLAIHHHVRFEDDLVHEDVYSPGLRDYAEDGRRYIFDAFMQKGGTEALQAKLKLASDPHFADLKDRIAEIARERLAMELDQSVFGATELAELFDGRELSPKTVSDMAQVLVDRLDDLQELMLRDTGHRAAWAVVADENTLRPSIARELEVAKRGAYTVDQESVTVDGKETDIRLRSIHGPESTIELKIGEKSRSAKDLRDALNDQLVLKYMAARHTQAGCLLVTVSNPDRRWQHPETKASMDQHQLQVFLDEAAQAAQKQLGGEARVLARVLDLTPRLKKEV